MRIAPVRLLAALTLAALLGYHLWRGWARLMTPPRVLP